MTLLTYPERLIALGGANLKGYWKLDETSGTVCADSSGNGKHGTYGGLDVNGATVLAPLLNQPPQPVPSVDSRSIWPRQGDPVWGSVLLPSMGACSGAEYTILAWARVNSTLSGSGTNSMIYAEARSDNAATALVGLSNPVSLTAMEIFYRNQAGNRLVMTTNVPNLSDRAHLLVTTKAGWWFRMFVDDAEVTNPGWGTDASASYTGGLADTVNNGTAAIGGLSRATGVSNAPDANIGHVAVLNRALTPTEIKAVYRWGQRSAFKGLAANR